MKQTPVQAEDRGDLKKLLKTEGGGIIFTTIQKFAPEEGSSVYKTLSGGGNIIVMADEAHRSQYGFAAKTIEGRQAVIKYGFAKYLRDGLPNATSSASPEHRLKDDASTLLFGNYIDVYDIEQAVEDGRSDLLRVPTGQAQSGRRKIPELDKEFDELTQGEEDAVSQRLKQVDAA